MSGAPLEIIPFTTGDSGPVLGTAITIPNAEYPGGSPSVGSPRPSALAVSPNGETAYVVDGVNNVVFPVNDLTSGSPSIGTPITGFYGPLAVAVSPDGSTVYVLDDNGIEVVDAATDTLTTTLSIPSTSPDTPVSMTISPDGKTAYVTTVTSLSTSDQTLYAVPLSGATPAKVATLPFGPADTGTTIAVSPDGDTAYVEGDPAEAATDQTPAQVAVVNLITTTTPTIIDLGTGTTTTSAAVAYGLAMAPDGSTVFATESCPAVSAGICSASDAGSLYAIDTATNTVSATYSELGTPLGIALPPAEAASPPGATLGAPGLNFGSEAVGGHTAHGPFTAPAKGSTLMSPANRRNPDHTNALGLFGWEVQPGYYKVQASASGCRRVVSTNVFDVPPRSPASAMKLSCPKLKRTASRIKLGVKKDSRTVIVKVSGKHGTALGTVTVLLGAKRLATLPLIGGKALVLVPAYGEVSASYSGDGQYVLSKARLILKRPIRPAARRPTERQLPSALA